MTTPIETGATPETALQVQVKNHGGDHCGRALRAVISTCDIPAISAWRSISGNDLASWFFSTLNAATDLISSGTVDNIFLVTGRFEHSGLDEPVYHAWLEFRATKPHAVVNVANIPERPLYAMDRDDFYRINVCRKRIQEIPLKRLRVKARQMSKKNEIAGHGKEVDLRSLTVKALGPTLKLLPSLQTEPA